MENENSIKPVEHAPYWTWLTLIGFCVLLLIFGVIKGCQKDDNLKNPIVDEFPKSGEGYVTADTPVKAYLDPQSSYGRTQDGKRIKAVFASDPNLFFVFHDYKPGGNSKGIGKWRRMPAGNYLVYLDSGYPAGTGASFWWGIK